MGEVTQSATIPTQGDELPSAVLAARAIELRALQSAAMREQSAQKALADLVSHRDATFVPGRGSVAPRVAFVVERPSQADATHRMPLRGRAGNVFNEMLDLIGLDRRQVYVTHLVPWLPPDNRETTSAERQWCGPWLRRELRVVGSPPVVLLGSSVSEYLTGRAYADVLGRWSYCIGLRTYGLSVRHPAYAVYQRNNLPVMREQYRRILDNARDRGEIVWGDSDATE